MGLLESLDVYPKKARVSGSKRRVNKTIAGKRRTLLLKAKGPNPFFCIQSSLLVPSSTFINTFFCDGRGCVSTSLAQKCISLLFFLVGVCPTLCFFFVFFFHRHCSFILFYLFFVLIGHSSYSFFSCRNYEHAVTVTFTPVWSFEDE